MNTRTRNVHGEPSWSVSTDTVDLHLTVRGGHLGPVRFRLSSDAVVSPYSLPPWKPAECPPGTPPVLRVLRGDFFCLPFGENGQVRYIHGDTANLRWRLLKQTDRELVAELRLRSLGGRVRKTIRLESGHRAVYQTHEITGLSGRFCFGHHAILEFPPGEDSARINTSPICFGGVTPPPFSNPPAGEYGILEEGAEFSSLSSVPLSTGGTANLHEYPAREGYEDLVMVSSCPGDFAWTAVTMKGYVWLSLKDPRVLPSTLFWMSNGGRHGPPWNGRHRRRIGLEEVCGYFARGVKDARKNLLEKKGVATTASFSLSKPFLVHVIHVIHPAPHDFGMVVGVERETDGRGVKIRNEAGQELLAPVRWEHLYGAS